MGLHFTWKDDLEALTTRMVPLVEKTLAQWEPRPHHGKIHTVGVEEWRQRYPGWRKVAALARRNDPEGRFVNAFLAKYLGLGDGGVGGGDRDGDNVCNDRVDGETCADGSISRGNNNAVDTTRSGDDATNFAENKSKWNMFKVQAGTNAIVLQTSTGNAVEIAPGIETRKGFQFRDTLKSNRPVFQVWRVDGSALDLGPELVHERVVLVT